MKFAATAVVLTALLLPMAATSAGDVKHPKQVNWAFDGVLGKNDTASVQRGLQVYREVCAACHGIKRVPFRSLQEIGFSEAEVKALAAEYTVADGPNDDGEMFERPGRASDRFPSPYANDKAARAMQNGALPPDLSLIIKARPDGANYVYSLLTGYEHVQPYRCAEVYKGKCVAFEELTLEAAEAMQKAAAEPAGDDAEKKAEATEPADEGAIAESTEALTMKKVYRCTEMAHGEEKDEATGTMMKVETCRELGSGMHYNPYFPGGQIAMAAPIADDQVTYQDDTKATKEQVARDVVSFLQWAAEPEMQARKRMGIKVMIFIAIMTTFFWFTKKRIWSKLDH